MRSQNRRAEGGDQLAILQILSTDCNVSWAFMGDPKAWRTVMKMGVKPPSRQLR